MFARLTFASALVATTAFAADLPRGPKPGPSAPADSSTRPQAGDAKPADFAVTALVVNQATQTVTATVTFNARIGLRGVPVRLRVAGGGEVRFEKTKLVDMAMNSTNEVTFKVDTAALLAALPAPTNPAVPKFLTVTATVDPDNAIVESSETNNTAVRILHAK